MMVSCLVILNDPFYKINFIQLTSIKFYITKAMRLLNEIFQRFVYIKMLYFVLSQNTIYLVFIYLFL